MNSDLQPVMGIDLDSWQQPLLQADSPLATVEWRGWGDSRPLVVLPWQRGLRPACDAESVASPWNCGHGWRQHASVGRNAARLPVWKLWDLLGEEPVLQDNGYLMGQSTREHAYKDAKGADRQVRVRDLLQCFLAPFRDSMARRRVVMAVPNTLDEWAQEDVLAALGPQSRLLWRPIAAAMTWGAAQPAHLHKQYDGKHLAVCEVRYDCITVCKVRLKQVIREGQSYLVPVRRLPRADNCAFQPILPLPFVLAEGLLDYHAIPPTSDLVWSLALGGDAIYKLLSAKANGTSERACLLPTQRGWQHLQISPDDLPLVVGEVIHELPDTAAKEVAKLLGIQKSNDGSSWLSQVTVALKKLIHQTKPDGFLLHGAGSCLPIDDTTLGATISRQLDQAFFPAQPMLRATEAADGVPDHMVARGCVLLAQRSQLGQPTYLDQLRQLDIIVQDKDPGSATFEDIIAKQLIPDAEVDGDSTYVGDDQSGFSLNKHEQHVGFLLRMQQEERLRELKQVFKVSTDRQEELVLRPTQQPARGHARIEVHNKRLFTGGYVLLDWSRMQTTHKTLESLNRERPRSFPPDMPDVEPDPALWELFEPYVDRYLETSLLLGGKEKSLGKVLGDYFFQRCGAVRYDPNRKDSLARQNTFGSSMTDGLPPDRLKAKDYLTKLQEDYAFAQIPDNRLKLIRAIAWTYQGETFPKLRMYLVDKLQQEPGSLAQEELTACGQLFHHPDEYQAMLLAILDVFDDRDVDSVGWYANGLRKLVTYRPDALQHADSDTVRFLILRLCRLIEYEMHRPNFGNRMKDSLIALLFMLRRRRYDTEFLQYSDERVQRCADHLRQQTLFFTPRQCRTLCSDDELLARLLALLWTIREPLRRATQDANQNTSTQNRAKLMLELSLQLRSFLKSRGSLAGFVNIMRKIDDG